MADEAAVTFDLLSNVLDVVVDYYRDNALGLPARQYVSAGVPVWDECEQVTVRAGRRFPHTGSVTFEDPQVFMSITQEGVAVEIQIVRCAPAFANEEGDPPTVAAMMERSCVLYNDSDFVLAAVRQAAGAGLLPGCHGVVWLGWQNDGESGNYMAGTTFLSLTQAY